MTQNCAVSAECHDISDLPVRYVDGPDSDELATVTKVHLLDGKRVVSSRYGEGFYWLPPQCARDVDSGRLLALWVSHPDASFPWSRTM